MVDGRYRYTADLLALENINPQHNRDSSPSRVYGFLPEDAWNRYLLSHPDRAFAGYLRRGIRYGFRIGFSPASNIKHITRNHQSVADNPTTVRSYIAKEVEGNKLTAAPPRCGVHTSPIGIIPKPHQPGKFRLIVDLSAPSGYSVNDGIPPQFSMHRLITQPTW